MRSQTANSHKNTRGMAITSVSERPGNQYLITNTYFADEKGERLMLAHKANFVGCDDGSPIGT